MNTSLIKQSIEAVVTLNDVEWLTVQQSMKTIELKKGNFLLHENNVCQWVAFVISGGLVYYKLLDNGKEITTDFAFEGDWVTDNHSRINHCASVLNIKAIEDTLLIVISNQALNELYIKLPKLERLGRILIENAFVRIAQQSIDLQTLTASERYNKLIKEFPHVFEKAPLYHIANYLGIAAKSLSRIRNNKI